MARLRDPKRGCAWDAAQTWASIAPYTIEEAYEVADAVERGAVDDLCEELGDLLLQVVFHARIAEEAGAFDFADVARGIADKLVRRHPHVFGVEGAEPDGDRAGAWEEIKARERAAKGQGGGTLVDVPVALPGLSRAVKLTRRAARVGFDWPDAAAVLDKLREEAAELEAEIIVGDAAAAAEELGDLLFVCANLARKLDVDPEAALRAANAKFTRRFAAIETEFARSGRTPADSTLVEMEVLWDAAKRAERA